ncbi:GFA family protein [Erythrobacter sp. YT30]|uniref:GFA family protein n=1 Tax=Erythrobacter sp. YT30 TaxID=1735012 RepID=UPI001F1FBF95|nr:GFA family protein [Erythrobacter sp. YT30]
MTIPAKPDYINLCDCSLCAKSGGAWGYFDAGDVKVEGETSAYRRSDMAQPAVELHFCPQCGTTTHWVGIPYTAAGRSGVNVRIFEPEDFEGIEARFLDGRNWTGSSAPARKRRVGIVGEDVFL